LPGLSQTRSVALVAGLLSLAASACHTEECGTPPNAGDTFEITINEHLETLSSCDERIAPSPGDTFVVTTGDLVTAGGHCYGRMFIGERPVFVPEDYGTCDDGFAVTLRCSLDTPGEQVCLSYVELRISGFKDSPGVGELQILSRRMGPDTANQCTQPVDSCGDRYSTTVRRIE
jgi:hypothetical protein